MQVFGVCCSETKCHKLELLMSKVCTTLYYHTNSLNCLRFKQDQDCFAWMSVSIANLLMQDQCENRRSEEAVSVCAKQ